MLDFFNDIPVLKLQRTAYLLAKRVGKVLYREMKLSMPQFMLLLAVRKKDKCNQTEVAGMRLLTQAAISRMVEAMLKKGLLTRKENPDNRREHVLELTNEGLKVVSKGLNIVKENMEEILGKLSTGERVKLDQILDKILGFVYTGKELYA